MGLMKMSKIEAGQNNNRYGIYSCMQVYVINIYSINIDYTFSFVKKSSIVYEC